MSDPIPMPNTNLHAYLDGELPEDERNAFESTLAQNPKLAEHLALYRADKEQLSAVYNRALSEAIPASWIEQIESHAMPRRFPMGQALAAAITLFAVLIGGTFLYRQQTTPHQASIVAEALAARDNALASHRQMEVRNPTEVVAAGRTLASTLAMRLKAPDLSRMGYKLASMKIYDRVPGGKAVELVYRRGDNRTFALYVRHATGAARFDEFTQGKMRVCIWQDDVLGTVMTGEMSAAEMQRLASLAYSGLET
jgi:anti-sigma factor RsiW